ncbi:CinA family protein [Mycobacterium sp. KBS0706]|uniref:CinA family protein n=1 Tax=Mycobacterium sp. KBS0706 TaxID=2578109 RepID=UPI00110FCDDF|nr:CinA family protein [Mycobacterium sp. KBS0706]TSD84401.1 CinA family protein [Mycobacterium sp. KBS0706]
MTTIAEIAAEVGQLLTARRQTIAVAESSAGGLVSAALLAVPGASAYFLGGAVVYTAAARRALLAIGEAEMAGLRPSTEPYAAMLARTVRDRFGSSWGIAETGAAGPTGNRYGDPAGHSCIALCGPRDLTAIIATGSTDRAANMDVFALALLRLLADGLASEPAHDGQP